MPLVDLGCWMNCCWPSNGNPRNVTPLEREREGGNGFMEFNSAGYHLQGYRMDNFPLIVDRLDQFLPASDFEFP
jgi:hypothetical protein